jgi:predicted RNase H-like HicB family nuclease
MQADYLRRFSIVEMTIHRIADLLPKGVQRVRFGKNGLAQSASGKAAFRRLLDYENDFVHALQIKSALDSPRFTVNSQERSREAILSALSEGAKIESQTMMKTPMQPDPRDYEIRIWYSAEKGDECFVAQVVEWPGIMAHGATREEAAREIQLALERALEVAAEEGIKPPTPALAHAS